MTSNELTLVTDAQEKGFAANFNQLGDISPASVKDLLLRYLEKNVPLIVCQQLSAHSLAGHFRVVTGLINNQYVRLHDPSTGPDRLVLLSEFCALWQKTSNETVQGGIYITIQRNA